jgi:hypothetical protein
MSPRILVVDDEEIVTRSCLRVLGDASPGVAFAFSAMAITRSRPSRTAARL